MSHPLFGPNAVRRDVFVPPSRLARETELIDEVYALFAPYLDGVLDADDTDEAVATVKTIAAGGSADADTAHAELTEAAQDFEESGDYYDAISARVAWLAAAWLTIKVGRRLRSDHDSGRYFGGLVNVLALPRLDDDFRELFGALERALEERDVDGALDALFPAMEPLLALVKAEAPLDPTSPEPTGELRRFADGSDIDVTAVHGRLESIALAAGEKPHFEAQQLAAAAWALAVWLRLRSTDGFGYEPNRRGYYPPMTLSWLLDKVVWTRARQPGEDQGDEPWYPVNDELLAAVHETRQVFRLVTGAGVSEAVRPEVSGAVYGDALDSVVERLSGLPEPQRLQTLYDWISPLLDEVAWANRDFLDDPEMTTAEAVERFRRIAAGGEDDADTVHWHLTNFAVVESEDQDSDMHVRSQAAFVAADWLCLKAGRVLRFDGELLGPYEPGDVAAMVNTLAWTRSRQVSHLPEYVDDFIERGHDLLTPIAELRAMREDLPEPG